MKFLQRKGYQILEKNLKNKIGEIDILARDGNFLVLVEVKTKSNQDFGLPQEMVNYKKQQKLLRLANSLLRDYPAENFRIDVVAIENREGRWLIEHIENAVEEI